jgi:uncharacterized protein
VESRTSSNIALARAISESGHRPHAFVAASAVGYYGNSKEKIMQEGDLPVDQSFMVQCCTQWEASAQAVADLGIRTVILRIGVVLSNEGGAFAEFAKPMRFGLGAYFGDGSAWTPWIHIDDVCNMIRWAAANEAANGVYNAVSPQPVRGKELVKALRIALKTPALLLPAPEFAIRFVFGEMSAVVLNSNRVAAEKILNAGYKFAFEDLVTALADVY